MSKTRKGVGLPGSSINMSQADCRLTPPGLVRRTKRGQKYNKVLQQNENGEELWTDGLDAKASLNQLIEYICIETALVNPYKLNNDKCIPVRKFIRGEFHIAYSANGK